MPIVLVVDDEPEVVALYTEVLEQMGHGVVTASDGTSALKRAVEVHPDLVITDLVMPRMNGIELCERLRRCEALARVPIILHSADRPPGEHRADAFLPKPCALEDFERLVATLLKTGNGVRRSDAGAGAAPGVTPGRSRSSDRSTGRGWSGRVANNHSPCLMQ